MTMNKYYFLNKAGYIRCIMKSDRLPKIMIDGSSTGFAHVTDSDFILDVDYSFGTTGDNHFCSSHMDDRHLIKKWASHLAELGIIMRLGIEVEFFLYSPDEYKSRRENSCYAHIPPPSLERFVCELENEFGFVESFHAEVGEDQYEIAIKYGDPLYVADSTVILRHRLEKYAITNNLICNFAPKPFPSVNGNGRHMHISFNNSGEKPYSLEDFAAHLCTDAYEYLSENILTVESQERLKPGFEAPTTQDYGIGDRTKMVRLIDGEHPRLELRLGDNTVPIHRCTHTIMKLAVDFTRNNK